MRILCSNKFGFVTRLTSCVVCNVLVDPSLSFG